MKPLLLTACLLGCGSQAPYQTNLFIGAPLCPTGETPEMWAEAGKYCLIKAPYQNANPLHLDGQLREAMDCEEQDGRIRCVDMYGGFLPGFPTCPLQARAGCTPCEKSKFCPLEPIPYEPPEE